MVLLGTLLLLIALMKRVPLSFEVGGARFDASYEDRAFEAGRDGGVEAGVQSALAAVTEAEKSGQSSRALLELLFKQVAALEPPWPGSVDQVADSHLPAAGVEPIGSAGFRGSAASKAAGITRRQLDYWARTGLVEPSFDVPGGRQYSERDVLLLRVVKLLLDAGVSLQMIRIATAQLQARSLDDLAEITLLSDGGNFYETTDDSEIVDVVKSGRGVFGVDVGNALAQVRLALSSG